MSLSPFPAFRILFALLLLVAPAFASLEDPTQLTWDEGTTEAGVNTVIQPSAAAGNYYYRINTRTATAWRTRLNVTQGEANLYIAKGVIPTVGNAATKASARPGSDGIILAPPDVNGGENWYIMVIASGENNAWSLVSGDPYIQDLGNLPFTDSNGDGSYNIGEPAANGGVSNLIMGPEGLSFFKVTLPPNVPAWALWMQGGQQLVGVRKNKIPTLFKTTPDVDRKRNGSLLLVPPYLGAGSDSYFVSVKGDPGAIYSMDSRIQPIQDIPFEGTIPNITVNDSPYRVYRVEVPAEQVIWDLSLTRLTGDPNICVSKQTVPGETDNTAISEALGEVNDSITLVSPHLTNGTWFITLFSSGPYSVDLKSGTPPITDIGYRDTVQNDLPQRAGWRYYRVPDVGAQLGTLGWQLELDDAPPNTKISLRRALAPGTWKQKTNGSTSPTTILLEDAKSNSGILQRVDHEADIWYVGVYQPDLPLGNYTLTLRDIVSTTAQIDNYETAVTGQIEGEWRYFRVIVPEDPTLLGWYVDLRSVTGTASAKITVRRDRLPPSTATVAATATDWPSGAGWAQDLDFTGIAQNADGRDTTGNFFLGATGALRPLKPGTYYVGVLAGLADPPASSTKTVSYTLRSRGVGGTYSIPVTPLDQASGSVTLNNLAPRDFRFYSFSIPQGAEIPSWDLRLVPTAGDMLMQVRRDSLPDFSTSLYLAEATGVTQVQGGKRLKKPGSERLTILPEPGESFLRPGTYYTAVVSEGTDPTTGKLGPIPATGTLTSSAPVPVTDLGTASATPSNVPFDIPAGELSVYQVTVPAGTRQLEAYLTGRVGNPGVSIFKGTAAPKPFPGNTISAANAYGWVGGQNGPVHPVLVTAHEPEAGVYTVVLRANPGTNNTYPDGEGVLHIRAIQEFPQLTVLGAKRSHTIEGQFAEAWQYFTLVVPENQSLAGIHIALRNVTSGQPRMVVRKGTGLAKDFLTTDNPNFGSESTTWPDNAQWYQTGDFTRLLNHSSGVSAAGRGFLCAYNAPMGPGTYTIGVSKAAGVDTVLTPNTPHMSYSIRVDGIGTGVEMDSPLTTVEPDNTASPAAIPALPEREMRFFKVTLPAGLPNWRVMLTDVYPVSGGTTANDGILAVHKGKIPTFDIVEPGALDRHGLTSGVLNRPDHFAMLPKEAGAPLEAGDYYIAVTSMGRNPTATKTGNEPCDLTLVTRGVMSSETIEPLAVGVETSRPYNLAPTEIATYRFVIPASPSPLGYYVAIARQSGAANFSLRRGNDGLPKPPGKGDIGFSGGLAFDFGSDEVVAGRIVYNAQPGIYEVVVRSSGDGYNLQSLGNMVVGLFDPGTGVPEVPLDRGVLSVENGGSTTDILPFRVVIPDDPNLKGWGVTLTGAPSSGKPCIIIRRGEPPTSTPGPQVTSDSATWPNLAEWKQTEDYTKLKNDPAGPLADRDRSQQYFVAARGRPLEPGVYYIGIDNRGTPLVSPRSFTIRTFAFGEGYSVPITDLTTVGSSAPVAVAEPRMPAAFKITIPPDTKAWSVHLANTTGDFTLRARKDYIPDTVNSIYPSQAGGVHVQKAGDERFTLLPKVGDDVIAPGDYYLVAASEGQNSSLTGTIIGTGAASGTITNLGPIPVVSLGTANDEGISQAVSLAPAEVKFFSVEVPAGINNLQFRLNDRSGEASIVVLPGTRVPAPGLGETYGVFGGQTDVTALKKDKAIINLGNPTPGTYTIAVRAGGTLPSSFAPASATLSVDILKPAPLNFSEALNEGNGFSHTDARSLADKQKYFYRVAIPPQGQGENEILGWLVTLDQGSPIVKLYQSEADFGGTKVIPMVGRTALIVPPLLSFGTNWFIEVEGVGTTDYVIRSQPVALTAAPWSLPTAFNAHAGDSNPGEPDGIGAGRQLSQDCWDFYALDVPEENLGLMRLALEASNGNPNVYIRHGGIPTTDHKSTGAGGTILYQFKMISEDSEAGNFSEPSDAAAQPERLKPGRYYIGVKSDPVALTRTSSRYRLKAHSGVVTDLDINSPVPLTGQNLAEKDWRYYRVTIPRTGIPAQWYPAFTRLHGTAQLYVRDTLPPFFNSSPTPTDWSSDSKNRTAAAAYLRAPAPGTVTLNVPPLRPGKTYYLGFYGATGGAFEVSSTVSAAQVILDAELAYDTGSITYSLAAGQKRLIRFHVPANATRVKFECSQSAPGVLVKGEQGAPPDPVPTMQSHIQSGTGFPAFFSVNRVVGNIWPIVGNQDYYLLLTNTTSGTIDSTVTMKGVNAATEDEDLDGMPDAWELLHFGNLTQIATGDKDADASTNLQEFQNGTLPNDAQSVLYPVTVTAPGGTFNVSPQQALYPKNTTVTLTATPPPGATFRRWICPGTATIDGNTNATLSFQIQNGINAKAIFEIPLGKAVDSPDTQAWTTSGNAAWFGQFEYSYDGQDAASSPPLAANQSATMSTVLAGPGTLSFRWKVSSKATNHYLTLMLDNTPQAGAISGTTMTDWAQVTLAIPAGNHTVGWRYSKNNSSVAGDDRGWVDRVTYTGWPSDVPTLESWRLASFTAAELGNATISGPEADPDKDGIENVLEAALGLGPKAYDNADEALKLVSAASAGGNRTIILQSKVAATVPSNITLRLQVGNGVGSWTTLATKTGDTNWSSQAGTNSNETNSGGSRDPVVFTETVAISGSGKRYYRLAAELVP